MLSRGPHIMKGYWQNPRETAAALEDGWLHTGDLGRLDEDGFLYITGRKKELLVLSNGKKVVPSHIEGILLTDPCIDQIVICGEGRNFLTALVVPHWTNLAGAMGCSATSTDPKVRTFLEARITQALKEVALALNGSPSPIRRCHYRCETVDLAALVGALTAMAPRPNLSAGGRTSSMRRDAATSGSGSWPSTA